MPVGWVKTQASLVSMYCLLLYVNERFVLDLLCWTTKGVASAWNQTECSVQRLFLFFSL